MNKFKKIIPALACAVLLLGLGSTALARGMDSGSGSSSSDTTKSSDDSVATTDTQTSTEVENHARDLAEQFRQKAKEQNAELKKTVSSKTEAEREKSCQARETSIQNRLKKRVASATKHKEVFDKIFTKVQNFHDTKNLSTPDYDSLVAAVNTAKANTETQIAALNSLDTNIDCSQANVADTLSTFKASLKSTRESLKAYQTALKNLIKAVHQSAEQTQSTESN